MTSGSVWIPRPCSSEDNKIEPELNARGNTRRGGDRCIGFPPETVGSGETTVWRCGRVAKCRNSGETNSVLYLFLPGDELPGRRDYWTQTEKTPVSPN